MTAVFAAGLVLAAGAAFAAGAGAHALVALLVAGYLVHSIR